MKIAYLSTFYPFRGGIAQFNAALYKQLKIDNDIRAYTFKVQYPEFLFPGKTQMVQENDNAEFIDSIPVLNTINPISYQFASKKISEFSPDLLLTKFWMPYFAPSLGYAASKMKGKCVRISILDNVIPHELRPGDIQLIKYFLNRNDGFIVMSEAVKNDLLRLKPNANFLFHRHPLYNHFGEKLSKSSARQELKLPQDKKIILCFGFIRDYKGIDLAIEAVSRLGDEHHLIIAGEVYGSFEKYEKQIKDLGVESKISLFTRYISDNETPLFFSAADVCLLPYKSATQSGIVAISYHFDLPVAATNVGGLSEMIEPFNSGIMIEKADAAHISGGLEKYFQSDIGEFVQNIHNYKSEASWHSLADNIIEFADKLRA